MEDGTANGTAKIGYFRWFEKFNLATVKVNHDYPN